METSAPASLAIRSAAIVAATLLVLVAGFQAYWAAGGSRGLAGVWGGRYKKLSVILRAGSAVSSLLFVLGAVVILSRAGHIVPSVPYGVVSWGTWIFTAILLLSAVANFVSRSNWERYLNGPLALAVALLCLFIARSPTPGAWQ